MENHTHDCKDTIKEAAELSDDGDAQAIDRARRADSEIAYEALAVNCAMGMFGIEPTTSNLMQLELAQELFYKYNSENAVGENNDNAERE